VAKCGEWQVECHHDQNVARLGTPGRGPWRRNSGGAEDTGKGRVRRSTGLPVRAPDGGRCVRRLVTRRRRTGDIQPARVVSWTEIAGVNARLCSSPTPTVEGGGVLPLKVAHQAFVADVTQTHALVRGEKTAALGDASYHGVEKRPENIGKSVTWNVAMKRCKRKALPNQELGRLMEKLEHLKAACGQKSRIRFMSSRTCSVVVRGSIVA